MLIELTCSDLHTDVSFLARLNFSVERVSFIEVFSFDGQRLSTDEVGQWKKRHRSSVFESLKSNNSQTHQKPARRGIVEVSLLHFPLVTSEHAFSSKFLPKIDLKRNNTSLGHPGSEHYKFHENDPSPTPAREPRRAAQENSTPLRLAKVDRHVLGENDCVDAKLMCGIGNIRTYDQVVHKSV